MMTDHMKLRTARISMGAMISVLAVMVLATGAYFAASAQNPSDSCADAEVAKVLHHLRQTVARRDQAALLDLVSDDGLNLDALDDPADGKAQFVTRWKIASGAKSAIWPALQAALSGTCTRYDANTIVMSWQRPQYRERDPNYPWLVVPSAALHQPGVDTPVILHDGYVREVPGSMSRPSAGDEMKVEHSSGRRGWIDRKALASPDGQLVLTRSEAGWGMRHLAASEWAFPPAD